jgi:integrase/recombinase XerD
MKLSRASEGFFLDRRASGYSPNTLAIYQWGLDLIQAYLNDPELEDIIEEDLQRFFVWLQQDYKPKRKNGDTSPLAPSSVENAWTAMRSFFGWAVELGHIKSRPDNAIRRPRYEPREIVPLTKDELEKLVNACEYSKLADTNGRKAFSMKRPTGARDLAIVLMLVDTGLRVSELARLKVRDVDLSDGEVYVAPYGTGRKTKSRLVYLGAAARRAVWRYLAQRDQTFPDDPLFLTQEGRAMDRNNIRHLLVALGERCGVNNVHPHRFRHTFAIQYLRNGGDIFTLQRMLGHRSLTMVLNYLDLADADTQAVHRKASPADRWRL